MEDFVANFILALNAICGKDNVGDHDRAGDRTAPRFSARHPHCRMPVYHRFNLLRVNLQSTYIDDAAPSPNKVVAVTPQFHHIAGINKTIRIDQRGCVLADIGLCSPFGAYVEASVDDFHFYAVEILADETCGKSLAPVIDGKADARLRRCVGMSNRGAGKGPRQSIKDGLIRDLAGKSNVSGREMRNSSAHQ